MDQTPDVNAAVARIEALLDEFGERLDARAREKAEELVQSLMEIYGSGLERILEIVGQSGDGGLLDRLAEDKLVASLLLIHGLHPVDAETRIRRALERLERRAAIRVRLLGVEEGFAKLRFEGGTNGCGSSAAALAEVIENAVQEAAPELGQVQVEGLEQGTGATPLVQIGPAS